MRNDSLSKKWITCFVAGIAAAALLLELGNSGLIPWFPPVIVFSLAGLSFLLSVVYPFVWQFRQKNQKTVADKIYGLLYSFIRYAIAFDLAVFGWKKIFGLQFNVPDAIAKMPMNQQSGEWLTWYYFGHSRSFVLILAFIQITGAWFLLFRRTMLLAAIVLFAFMLNLLLVNIFYQMNAGALTQSILITVAISFLILLDYDRLLHFFIHEPAGLLAASFKNAASKNIARLSVVVLSLLYVMYITTL